MQTLCWRPPIYIIFFKSLLVFTCLFDCSLRNNNIGSKGARFLAEALKMNQVLVSVKWVHVFILLHISAHVQRYLKTDRNCQNDTWVSSFQSNNIEEEGAQALAEVLQCNRKLVSLKWVLAQFNFLISRGFEDHAKAFCLQCLSMFFFFSLSKNTVGGGGAKKVAEALKMNQTLTKLM